MGTKEKMEKGSESKEKSPRKEIRKGAKGDKGKKISPKGPFIFVSHVPATSKVVFARPKKLSRK